jgi:hypothetical protein
LVPDWLASPHPSKQDRRRETIGINRAFFIVSNKI